MNLYFYESKSGKNVILEYINSLSVDEQVDGYSVLKCLEEGKIDSVRFKRWEKKVYEVYFYKHNRIFYVTADENNMYLLHACRKQCGGIVMPFTKVNVGKTIEKKKRENPEFKKVWDDSREEYRLIEEMTVLRKAERITQSDLAEMTGSRQQVISRIEKKENSPSLRCFCNILNALGYELKIVKRKNI